MAQAAHVIDFGSHYPGLIACDIVYAGGYVACLALRAESAKLVDSLHGVGSCIAGGCGGECIAVLLYDINQLVAASDYVAYRIGYGRPAQPVAADGHRGSVARLGLDDGLPVVRAREYISDSIFGGLLIGEMVLGLAVYLFTVDSLVISVATLREIHGIAVAVDSVPVGPDGGESAHGLIPAGGGNGHLGTGVEKDSLGCIVPWTAEPYTGLGGYTRGSDGAVVEHIAPFHIHAVGGCHYIAAALAVDVEDGVVDKDVAAVVDEVDRTFDKRVAHIGTVA